MWRELKRDKRHSRTSQSKVLSHTQGGCNDEESRPSEIELINDLTARSERYLISGDLDAYMTLFDDGIVTLTPSEVPIVGIEATRSYYQGLFEQSNFLEVVHDTKETEVAGALAFTWGIGSGVTMPKAAGEQSTFRVKYLHILRKQTDGSWAYYRTMNNF